MSNEIKDGGPAFPTPSGHARVKGYHPGRGDYEQTVEVCRTGMSLRQWYAGMAMQGDWAAQGDDVGIFANNAPDSVLRDRAALYFRMADAMIRHEQKERE